MSQSNYKLNMSGITVSNKNQEGIRSIMENLVSKSPSDGYLSLYIVNEESQVNGFLSISSQQIKLDFSHCGQDPLSVVKLLSLDLLKQIGLWKVNRVF